MERRNHLDNAVKKIREKRDRILHRVEEQGKVLFRKTERELERLAHDHSPVEPGKRKPQRELREIENRFRSQVRRQKRKRSKIENLTPGEWVRILDLNREGMVSEVQKAIDVAEVVVGKLRIKTSLRNLERAVTKEPVPTKPPAPLSIVSSSSVADREANVVGLTVDEAVPIVDKFIDTALVEGLDSVTIIHGGGSGRLRDGIRDYLKKHRAVTGFRYGDPRRGGRGVTVVRLGWDQDAEATSQEDEHPVADGGLPRR
jgi:DNA mismatch repair protein MutS2